MMSQPLRVTVEEIAAHFRVKVGTIKRFIREGILTSSERNKEYFNTKDLEALLDSLTVWPKRPHGDNLNQQKPATAQHAAPIVQPTREPVAQPTVAQPTVAQPTVAQPISQPPASTVAAPRARLVLYKRWASNGVYELVDSTGRTVKDSGGPGATGSLS